MSSYQPTDSILLIESEDSVRCLGKAYLNRQNFRVTAVRSGEEAINLLDHTVFDLILTELSLPGMDGFEVLREVRVRDNTPIIVTSNCREKDDPVRLLNEGADDFLPKPYYPEELVARVRALLRRARLPRKQNTNVLSLLPARKAISISGTVVDLTQREFDVLYVLFSEPAKVFSRRDLFQCAWGPSKSKAPRRIDLYISRIRIKIFEKTGLEIIQSVYGKGYRIRSDFAQNGQSGQLSYKTSTSSEPGAGSLSI